MPPAMYLPKVVKSGVTPSIACMPPSLWREVITSSKISSAPVSEQASRRALRNSRVAGMQPPEPSMGSTSTAPNCGPSARICAAAPAASL